MAIPGNLKISESGGWNERAGFTRFHGKMVYRIPQSAVETYRNDFTPGLLTGGVTATASSVTASGVVTTYTAAFSNTHVGNPISLGAYGTYYISSYSSSIKVDTTFSTAGAALGTTAVSVNTQKLWPGRTDLLAPRLTEYNLEPQYPGVAGMSRVTMYYNTPSIHQLVTSPRRGRCCPSSREGWRKSWSVNGYRGEAPQAKALSPELITRLAATFPRIGR